MKERCRGVRREFTCSHCRSVLATIRPATVLRVAPGVAGTQNWRFGNVRLTYPFGQIESYDVPRKVKTLTVGGTDDMQAA